MATSNPGTEDISFYKSIINKLRVVDLQVILSYVGKKSHGRKSELQSRVMAMIKKKNSASMIKTKEVYAQYLATQLPVQPTQLHNKVDNYSVSPFYPSQGNSTILSNFPLPVQSAVSEPNMAVHPDVKFRKLPFYDQIDVLLRSSSLVSSNAPTLHSFNSRQPVTRQQAFQFYLSPQHIKHLQNNPNTAQILIRFCVIDTTEQDDAFPNGLSLKVNNKFVALPNLIPSNKQGVPPKRIPEPLNVTSKCSFSVSQATKVFVTWEDEYNSPSYALGIFLVNKLDSNDLIQRLKCKGNRPAEFTMGYIKEKYSSDSEICTLELTSSLLCPLGRKRMVLPAKATTCNHLQCFDAPTFIKMNELKPKWHCPVCDKPCYYENLNIDGYFSDIIKTCPSSNDIMLRPDGTWAQVEPKDESEKHKAAAKHHAPAPTVNISSDNVSQKEGNDCDIITLDSDSADSDSDGPVFEEGRFSPKKPPKKRFKGDDSTVCVDLTEDSGGEDNGKDGDSQDPFTSGKQNKYGQPYPLFHAAWNSQGIGVGSPDSIVDGCSLSSTPPVPISLEVTPQISLGSTSSYSAEGLNGFTNFLQTYNENLLYKGGNINDQPTDLSIKSTSNTTTIIGNSATVSYTTSSTIVSSKTRHNQDDCIELGDSSPDHDAVPMLNPEDGTWITSTSSERAALEQYESQSETTKSTTPPPAPPPPPLLLPATIITPPAATSQKKSDEHSRKEKKAENRKKQTLTDDSDDDDDDAAEDDDDDDDSTGVAKHKPRRKCVVSSYKESLSHAFTSSSSDDTSSEEEVEEEEEEIVRKRTPERKKSIDKKVKNKKSKQRMNDELSSSDESNESNSSDGSSDDSSDATYDGASSGDDD